MFRVIIFNTRFESKMRESGEKEIVIHNVSHPVFKVLLEYLYTKCFYWIFVFLIESYSICRLQIVNFISK